MEELTFEQALKKLEEYVKLLEKGKLSLDESIKVYSEATNLSAFCTQQIENAKIKISKIDSQGDKNV